MPDRISIEVGGSSCVASADYYPDSRTLRIAFVGGDTYDYLSVPAATVAAFAAAESKGRFVNAAVKPHFACRKLT